VLYYYYEVNKTGGKMSAEIVERETIQYIITAIEAFGNSFGYYYNNDWHYPKTNEERQVIGQRLWDTNILSVKVRYNNIKDIRDLPGPCGENYIFKYKPCKISFNPIQIIKTCRYYSYQTCEFEGWEESEAKAIIDVLIDLAITKLPGYEQAEWGAPKEMYIKEEKL
jgi:hypothetical protein